MSWLNNYQHKKQEEKKLEEKTQKEIARREEEKKAKSLQLSKTYKRKARTLSSMIVKLLKELGNTYYENRFIQRSYFFRKYDIHTPFLHPFAMPSTSYTWTLEGRKLTDKHGVYSSTPRNYYSFDELNITLKRKENGRFYFDVHGVTTPNTSRKSLQAAILYVLESCEGLPKGEWSDEYDPWD